MRATPLPPKASWSSPSCPTCGRWHEVLKRWFDIALAGLGLLSLWPVGLLLGLLIKGADGGPVFFGQIRIGRFGQPFRLWKFRSLVANAENMGPPLTPDGDARITAVGRWLRRSKLDELPQLWNVLVGEMSFVGPRPELPRYVADYSAAQWKILEFKPGITDPASLCFRHEAALLKGARDVDWFYQLYCLPRKLALNQEYARRANLATDIWIILQTICPRPLPVSVLYGLLLAASSWLALQLQADFQLPRTALQAAGPGALALVMLQLSCLGWMGQLAGRLSDYGIAEIRHAARALALAAVSDCALSQCIRSLRFPGLGATWIDAVVALTLVCAWRLACRQRRERAAPDAASPCFPGGRVAIIGTALPALLWAEHAQRYPGQFPRVLAFFDDDPTTWHRSIHRIPVIGMPECLLNGDWHAKLDSVLIAIPHADLERRREIRALIRGLRLKAIMLGEDMLPEESRRWAYDGAKDPPTCSLRALATGRPSLQRIPQL